MSDGSRPSLPPREGVEYATLQAFAERQYDQVRESNAKIDQKAEWLFGVALVAIGAAYAAAGDWGVSLGWFVPSVAAAFAVLFLAVKTRIPERKPLPFGIRSAVDIAHSGYVPAAWMVASLHCAFSGLQRLNHWKGRHLEAAARALILGLILFALPLWVESAFRSSSPRSFRTGAEERIRADEESAAVRREPAAIPQTEESQEALQVSVPADHQVTS